MQGWMKYLQHSFNISKNKERSHRDITCDWANIVKHTWEKPWELWTEFPRFSVSPKANFVYWLSRFALEPHALTSDQPEVSLFLRSYVQSRLFLPVMLHHTILYAVGTNWWILSSISSTALHDDSKELRIRCAHFRRLKSSRFHTKEITRGLKSFLPILLWALQYIKVDPKLCVALRAVSSPITKLDRMPPARDDHLVLLAHSVKQCTVSVETRESIWLICAGNRF